MKLHRAIAGLIAAGVATPDVCGEKPATALKLATSVNLENKRRVPLLHFEIVMPGKDKAPEMIVGKLEKPLAAGQAASFPLTGGKGCVFEARWAFEDFRAEGDVDLCNQAHIVLVD
jgi:hypothetical protein